MGIEGSTTEEFCPHCGREVEIIETVPWQEDICKECNLPIPDED